VQLLCSCSRGQEGSIKAGFHQRESKEGRRSEKAMKMISRLQGILVVVMLGGVLAVLSPLEQTYFSIPNRNNTRDYLFNLTSAPHLVGMKIYLVQLKHFTLDVSLYPSMHII
jgi:hypothetical protein